MLQSLSAPRWAIESLWSNEIVLILDELEFQAASADYCYGKTNLYVSIILVLLSAVFNLAAFILLKLIYRYNQI